MRNAIAQGQARQRHRERMQAAIDGFFDACRVGNTRRENSALRRILHHATWLLDDASERYEAASNPYWGQHWLDEITKLDQIVADTEEEIQREVP